MSPESNTGRNRYLDPKILSKAQRLGIQARLVVEGFISGMHRSPYHGFSVEFAQHRQYVPGDDLKHLDWKVLARTDRLYIRQYEEETNLRAHFLLDTSKSMAYRSGEHSKLEYSKVLVASLIWLLLRQQDAAGVTIYNDRIRNEVPASSSPGHMRDVLYALESAQPEEDTDMSTVFHELAERITKRGLIMLVSDLLDDPEVILKGLKHFRHKRHEVVVFHVLDHQEIEFPFRDLTMFEGLETFPELMTDPRALRDAYLDAKRAHCDKIRAGCLNNRMDYVPLDTSQPLDAALSAYLATRAATRLK